jgi:hypothetical protein
VKNLQAMQAALDNLGPAGAEFARFLDQLEPELRSLQLIARAGMFPGFEEGIKSLLPLLPQVRQVVADIATELGGLGADAGKSLGGPKFEAFFNYLQTDAAPTLDAFARSTGNVIEGLANLMVAFAPLTRDFTGGMQSMTAAFAHWSAGLSKTQGFQNFVAYIRESGPQVLEALGAIGSALVGIVRAAAPFGQAVLPALTALANIVAAIANSPIGPPLFTAAAAFVAVSRASTLAAAGVERYNAASLSVGKVGLATKVAGIAAAFGLLGNEFAKLNGSKVDLSKLTSQLDDIAKGDGAESIDHITASLKTLTDRGPDAYELPTLGGLLGNTPRDNAADYIKSVDQSLAAMVQSGNADKAAKIFAQIQEARTGLSAKTHEFAPIGQSAKDFSAYASAVNDARSANNEYADTTKQVAQAAAQSRAQILGLMEAMQEQANVANSAFSSETNYREALKAAQAQAAKNTAGINGNS